MFRLYVTPVFCQFYVCLIKLLLISLLPQYLPLLNSIHILLLLIHISLTASVYTTVDVAVERFTSFAVTKVNCTIFEPPSKFLTYPSQASCVRVVSLSSLCSPSPTTLSGSLSLKLRRYYIGRKCNY